MSSNTPFINVPSPSDRVSLAEQLRQAEVARRVHQQVMDTINAHREDKNLSEKDRV